MTVLLLEGKKNPADVRKVEIDGKDPIDWAKENGKDQATVDVLIAAKKRWSMMGRARRLDWRDGVNVGLHLLAG